MKKVNSIILIASAVMFVAAVNASAEGEVTVGVDVIDVSGDDGRFREDQYREDGVRGGIESLHWTTNKGNDEIELDLRAFYNDEYRLKLRYTRPDAWYLLLDGQWDRRYYDGSNEAWDPTAYGLTGNEFIPDNRTSPPGQIDDGFYKAGDFADRPDDDLYTDRMDLTLEYGIRSPDLPEMTFGWHRWEREGEELLLRGERTRVTNPNDSKGGTFFPRTRSVAALSEVDGVSDLFYFEIADTFGEKYNLRFRQEYESYRDNQTIAFPRYLWDQSKASAEIEQYRTFEDEPEFENSVSMLMFDSQLNDETFVSAGYMYGHLNNTSSREVVRPNRATSSQIYHSEDTETDNTRQSHVAVAGFRRDNLLGVENLTLVAGLRVEDADTDAETSLLAGGKTRRDSMTDLEELRVEEVVELIYSVLGKTVISLEADLEQRDLDWSEYEDVGSHEIFGTTHFNSGIQFFDYATDIEHRNQEYTFKVVDHSLKGIKLTGKYSYKDLDRDYDTKRDADPRFFPGRIGGYTVDGHEVTVGLDHRRLFRGCNASIKYQFVQEDIETDFAEGETQDWQINRVSASLAGAPHSRLFLLTSAIYETYELQTPVNITGSSHWAPGTDAYDYDGDYVTLLANADYIVSDLVKAHVDYQMTSAMEDNEYRYHKATCGVAVKKSETETIRLVYEYYDFEDREGDGFDDYTANGLAVNYSRTF